MWKNEDDGDGGVRARQMVIGLAEREEAERRKVEEAHLSLSF